MACLADAMDRRGLEEREGLLSPRLGPSCPRFNYSSSFLSPPPIAVAGGGNLSFSLSDGRAGARLNGTKEGGDGIQFLLPFCHARPGESPTCLAICKQGTWSLDSLPGSSTSF